MATIPPSLRRLFWAGGNALRTMREFHGAAESCRGLLEVDGYRQLLAAGTAYSPLFDGAAAGNPLGGVMGRLAERVEQGKSRHVTRGRSRRGLALEAGTGWTAGEFPDGPEVAHVKRAAASTSSEFTRAVRRETVDAQAPGRAVRSTRRGSDLPPPVVPPSERRASPGGADAAVLEPRAVGTGAPGRAASTGAAATIPWWTGEDAARELAVRADRAGLHDVWSRPAVTPAFAVSAPAPVVASRITQVVAARLAPLVETIAWRYAHPTPVEHEGRFGGVEPTAGEHASASTFHREATTPLRRLAARGRVREAVPAHAAGSPKVPNVRQSRAAAARLSSPLRGRVLEARGREEPDQPGPDRGGSRDIAETLADVLYREALRNGIDPLEYES